MSDKDRREIERVTNQEVLESEAYPEILFVAERVALTGSPGGPFQATLDGELTLHGVSRPCQVPLRIYPSGDMVRAQGETTLRQSDYRIEPGCGGGRHAQGEGRGEVGVRHRRPTGSGTAAGGGPDSRSAGGRRRRRSIHRIHR